MRTQIEYTIPLLLYWANYT